MGNSIVARSPWQVEWNLMKETAVFLCLSVCFSFKTKSWAGIPFDLTWPKQRFVLAVLSERTERAGCGRIDRVRFRQGWWLLVGVEAGGAGSRELCHRTVTSVRFTTVPSDSVGMSCSDYRYLMGSKWRCKPSFISTSNSSWQGYGWRGDQKWTKCEFFTLFEIFYLIYFSNSN